jgi:hypothetical protein
VSRRACCICDEGATVRLANDQPVCALHGMDYQEWLDAHGYRNNRRAANAYIRKQQRAKERGRL